MYICVFMTCPTSHCICDTKVHEIDVFVVEVKFSNRCIALQWCNTNDSAVSLFTGAVLRNMDLSNAWKG